MITSNERKKPSYITLESDDGTTQYSYLKASKTDYPLTPAGIKDLNSKIAYLEENGFQFKYKAGAEKIFAVYSLGGIMNQISLHTFTLHKTFKEV